MCWDTKFNCFKSALYPYLVLINVLPTDRMYNFRLLARFSNTSFVHSFYSKLYRHTLLKILHVGAESLGINAAPVFPGGAR